MAAKTKAAQAEMQAEDNEKTANLGGALATLLIGNTYIMRGVTFKNGEARPVSREMAEELEELTRGSTDSRTKRDRSEPRFEIEYITDGEDDDEQEEVGTGAKRRKVSSARSKPSRSTR